MVPPGASTLSLAEPLWINNTALSIGTLEVLSHHVVGGSVLLPGVGYREVAFVADAGRRSVLSAVAFVRGAARERCAL